METFQGYFVEQNKFIPIGTVRIPLRRRTIVTILDEPMPEGIVSELEDVASRQKELA